MNPLYDPLLRLHTHERRWKGQLVDQMGIRARQRILDLGCGTGTLPLLIKEKHADAEVVGLDPDSGILAIARRKAQKAGAEIRFEEGFADRLPYEDSSFDRVVSSLVFHHLPRETKPKALRLAGRLPALIVEAGFTEVAEIGRVLLGAVYIYRARKPADQR